MALKVPSITIKQELFYDKLKVYLGIDNVTNMNVLIYQIKQQIGKKTKQFLQYNQCPYLQLVDKIIKIDKQQYINIIINENFQPLNEINNVTEVDIWRWIEQLSKILISLYEGGIILQHINNNLLYYDQNTRDIQLFDYSEIKMCQTEQQKGTNQIIFSNEFVKSIYNHILEFINYIYANLNLISKQNSVILQMFEEAINNLNFPIHGVLTHPLLQLSKTTNKNYISHIENYEVVRQLGVGGFGRIDLIKDTETNNLYALKTTMHRQLQETEVQLLQICCHPNIIQYIDHKTDNKIYELIISYCNGGDLLTYLSKNGPPDEERMIAWAAQLVSALFWLHKHKILHRDIKLQNILLNDGDLVLTDFGGSKYLTDNQTTTIIGTPIYFSPEQYYNKEYTFKADIFSLGLVLFNIALGAHTCSNTPESSANFFKAVKADGNAKQLTKHIKNEKMRFLIDQMLQFDPENRISAQEICQIEFIKEYMLKKQLPGPITPTILVERNFIKKGRNILKLLEMLQNLTQNICEMVSEYIKNNGNQIYFYVLANIIPNYVLQTINQEINDDLMESNYIQTIIVEQCQQIQTSISEILQIQNNNLLYNYLNSITYNIKQITQNVIISENNNINMIIQPMVESISSFKGTIIIITPALYLTESIIINSDNLLLIVGTLFIKKKITLNVQSQSSTIIIQKHVGESISIEAEHQNVIYTSEYAKNSLILNCQHCFDVTQISKNDTDLQILLKYATVAFPALLSNKVIIDQIQRSK